MSKNVAVNGIFSQKQRCEQDTLHHEKHTKYQASSRPTIAYSIFTHTGIWKGNSKGVCGKHFPRESGTKIIFPKGVGQVYQRDHTS